MKARLLVIDDDSAHREGMAVLLEEEGYQVDQADGAEPAMTLIHANSYDLIITDYKMHKIDGMELLKMINDFNPLLPVIMVTGYSSIEHAVQAVHLGALDYIPKPVDPAKLRNIINRVLESSHKKPSAPAEPDTGNYIHFGEIIGNSRPIRQIVKRINEIANIDVPVLVSGESGTGKELVARALHHASSRSENKFVAINTGAIPRELINSELFGHEKGSFTGAVDQKKGKFEEADGGTLFLDEISSMSEAVQIALLRVLETGQIERVGGNRSIPVDVRIVAATNEDLRHLIEKRSFREDLFYRLNVYNIALPPLRERKTDIGLLAKFFMDQYCTRYQRQVTGFDEAAIKILENYSWPGNVRELRNVVLQAVISARGTVRKKDLPETVRKNVQRGQQVQILAGTPLPDVERTMIIKTLQMARGNKLKAAELLSISRRSLYNKIEEYQIRDEEYS